MAHTTTSTPATGWWAAELIQPDGTSAPNPVAAVLVLDAVFPDLDLAIDPTRQAEGYWLIELPTLAQEVLFNQGFIEIGQPHLGLVRIEAEAR